MHALECELIIKPLEFDSLLKDEPNDVLNHAHKLAQIALNLIIDVNQEFQIKPYKIDEKNIRNIEGLISFSLLFLNQQDDKEPTRAIFSSHFSGINVSLANPTTSSGITWTFDKNTHLLQSGCIFTESKTQYSSFQKKDYDSFEKNRTFYINEILGNIFELK